MRFATRAFLWSFIPFTALLLCSFWAMRQRVIGAVRDGVHETLRNDQRLFTRVSARSELRNSRSLHVVAQNPALEAGLQVLTANRGDAEARLTVDDQLREICSGLGFDFVLVSDVDSKPLAGVIRRNGSLVSLDLASVRPPKRGYLEADGIIYQVASVPVNQGPETLATLVVGERFGVDEFTTPAVLTHNGKVVVSNIPGTTAAELETALRACNPRAECAVTLGGESWLSLPLNTDYSGDGYALRSMQSVDAASAPVQSVLSHVFVVSGLGALVAAFIVGALSSRSVARPLARVVAHLRASERTGELSEFPSEIASVHEMSDLADSFNRAALAIREGHQTLHRAYVEFVESLARAVDARDPYTAGHSHRVSEYTCAIAEAMNFSGAPLEELRVAALLHDIGKIGIADHVLQKPGKLTAEEFAIIQQHPTIGKRILEGVQGFHPYLDVVELHHEDWDGTGYPRGLRGEAVPLTARIVHVADAYDAMTSDRPYRRGMSHDLALRIIRENAGKQFDPAVVEIFLGIADAIGVKRPPVENPSLAQLADALEQTGRVA